MLVATLRLTSTIYYHPGRIENCSQYRALPQGNYQRVTSANSKTNYCLTSSSESGVFTVTESTRMLSGKRAIVTGASSGIGLATARIFCREGAKVCATGRNVDALSALASEIGCEYVVGDLSKAGSCEIIVSEAVEKLGGLSTVVNCAGILKGGAFGDIGLENFKENFGANTQAVYEMMVHAIPHLKAAGANAGPSIVNVTSVNGQQSFAGCASYCASKAAADMLTQCAAVDLAPFGIRCNSVNPGVVVTELQKRGGMNDEAYASFLDRSIKVTHPLAASRGYVGKPEEVGELIAFLASDKAHFITGDCIKIDGGRACLGAR